MPIHKISIWVSLLVVLLILVCTWLTWRVTVLSVENAFVLDYVKIFYEMEEKAVGGELTPDDAAGYVKSYYPVGTKLHPNTVPSEIVETIRNKVLERLDSLRQDKSLGEENETRTINGQQ